MATPGNDGTVLPGEVHASCLLRGINNGSGMIEQFCFFKKLFLSAFKSLIVCFAQIGKHANGRLNDLFQQFHFSGFRYAGFKQSQCMFCVHLPYTKRYTNL